MVTEQIYINGTAADMGTDKINLSYENNYFGAVDTLKLSFSYAFTLPRTLKNDAIFSQGYDATTGGESLRKYYACEYKRNGVVIINGKICVNDVTARGYSCNLVWGLDELRTMADEKLKLWQLPAGTSHQNDILPVSSNPTPDERQYFTSGTGFVGFADYYPNASRETCRLAGVPYTLPVINVQYVLDLIFQRYGVTLSLPQDKQHILNNMVIALTTAKAWRENMETPRGSFILDKQFSEQHGYQYQYLINKNANGIIYQRRDPVTGEYMFTASQNCTLKNVHIEFTNDVQFNIDSAVFGYHVAEYDNARALWVVMLEFAEIAFNDGDDFAIKCNKHDGTPDVYPHEWIRNLTLLQYDFDVKADGQGVKDLGAYFVPANLPDMTAIDFIKEICVFLGVVPTGVTRGVAGAVVLNCGVLDSVLTGEVSSVEALEIEQLTPHYSDVAQSNVFKFATNELQTNERAGALLVQDETAQITKDYFTSKFASLMGLNEIPLWDVSGESGEIPTATLNELAPVLCILDETKTAATLAQGNLNFNFILANYYATKKDILNTPLVVDVVARLTPQQVAKLDGANVYYIPALKNYFVPLNITTNGDTYKLKLIRLTRGTAPTPPPDPDIIVITDYSQYFQPFHIDAQTNTYIYSGALFTGVAIPIPAGVVSVEITAPKYHAIQYAQLMDVDNMGTYNAPHYAEDYNAVVEIPAGTTETHAKTENANYLYFTRYFDAGFNQPVNVKFLFY